MMSWLKEAIGLLACAVVASSFFGDGYDQIKLWEMVDDHLPRSVIPEHYRLLLYINVNKDNFTGTVDINIKCLEPTNTIILHAGDDLHINTKDITLTDNDVNGIISLVNFSRNSSNQTLIVSMQNELQKGSIYELHLSFSGQMAAKCGDDLKKKPIFKYGYPNSFTGRKSWYVGTHLMPKNARRVFPCFDEPSLKATFDIVVGHLMNVTALSVTPVEYTKKDSSREGWVLDHFARTPPLSPFSVGVIVSDYESDAPVKVSTSKGHFLLRQHYKQDCTFKGKENSTNMVALALKHIEDFFGIPYPLPELNIVGVPIIHSEATNSMGLIISEETAVHGRYPHFMKQLVYQWIWHVVTPEQWRDFNVTGILSLFLTHNALRKFNGHVHPTNTLYTYDSLSQREPFFLIRPSDTGEWFLQMLFSTLTEKSIKKGFKRLLSKNKFGTFTEDTLWDALTRVAHKDGTLPESVTVGNISRTWLNSHHFPVLTVTRNYDDNTAILEQHMFMQEMPHNLTQEEQNTFWWIPIMYCTPDNSDPYSILPVAWMKDEKYFSIDNLPNSDSFIIVNPNDTGMFMVNYDQNNWRLLCEHLTASGSRLPSLTRRKLLADALFLSSAGELSYIVTFNMTLFLFNETDYDVWSPLLKLILYVQKRCEGMSVADKLNIYLKQLLLPKMSLTKPDYKSNPRYSSFFYNAELVLHKAGNQKQLEGLYKRLRTSRMEKIPTFTIYDNGTNLDLLCPELMRNCSDDLPTCFEKVEKLDVFIDEPYYYLDRCPGYLKFVESLLNGLIDDETTFSLSKWDVILKLITASPQAHNITFNFFQQHFSELKLRFYATEEMWKRLIEAITSNIKSAEVLNKFLEFCDQQKSKRRYSLTIAEESIQKAKQNVAWFEKNMPDIEYWFDHILPTVKYFKN